MLNAILVQRKAKLKTKIAVKSLVSVVVVVMAIALPQIFHIVAGASGGVTWLPMYLPVVIGGCVLGAWWGLAVGIASPVMSYLFTSLVLGNAMPALERLPFMVAELAIIALVAGLFSKKIAQNSLYTFPAVIAALFVGRGAFVLLALIFSSVSSLNVSMVLAQIQSGLLGTIMIIVVIPIITYIINKLAQKESDNE